MQVDRFKYEMDYINRLTLPTLATKHEEDMLCRAGFHQIGAVEWKWVFGSECSDPAADLWRVIHMLAPPTHTLRD
jgi:hypothetical protein